MSTMLSCQTKHRMPCTPGRSAMRGCHGQQHAPKRGPRPVKFRDGAARPATQSQHVLDTLHTTVVVHGAFVLEPWPVAETGPLERWLPRASMRSTHCTRCLASPEGLSPKKRQRSQQLAPQQQSSPPCRWWQGFRLPDAMRRLGLMLGPQAASHRPRQPSSPAARWWRGCRL